MVTLTIDGSKISKTLTDFPLMVKLSPQSLGLDYAHRKYLSITTGGGQQCYVEIESWSDTEAILWVKVPTISAGVNTILTLSILGSANTGYVGDTLDSTTPLVWNNGYVSVFHLAGNAYDSCLTRNHGTIGAGVQFIPAKIGLGAQFSPTTGKLTFPDHPNYSIVNNGDKICVQYNFKKTVEFAYWRILGKMSVINNRGFEWATYCLDPTKYAGIYGSRRFYIYNPQYVSGQQTLGVSGDIGTPCTVYNTPDTPIIPVTQAERARWTMFEGKNTLCFAPMFLDQWYLMHWQTFNVNTRKLIALYQDEGLPGRGVNGTGGDVGVDQGWNAYNLGEGVSGGAHIIPEDTPSPFSIGSDGVNTPQHGVIDEVRISSVNRNMAWMEADYYSQNNQLVTVSGIEVMRLTYTSIPIPIQATANGVPLNSGEAIDFPTGTMVTLNAPLRYTDELVDTGYATLLYKDYAIEEVETSNVGACVYGMGPYGTGVVPTITIVKDVDHFRINKFAADVATPPSTTVYQTFCSIYGFAPTFKSRCVVELGVTSGSASLLMGGITLSLGVSNGNLVLAGTDLGVPKAIIIVDTNILNGTAKVTVENSTFLKNMTYTQTSQDGISQFTPDQISITSLSTGTIIRLYRVIHQIETPTLVTPIGSNKLQAYGYDGPHNSNTQKGMNAITTAGMGGTIFADISPNYTGNATYVNYLKTLLNAGTGWDLGIHFTEECDEKVTSGVPNDVAETWAQVQTSMASEKNIIAQRFGTPTIPVPPLSWCILGIGVLPDKTQNQWVSNTLQMFARQDRVLIKIPFSARSIQDYSFQYFNNAAKGGMATYPIYIHETDAAPTTLPSSVNLNNTYFTEWLGYLTTMGVRLIGYAYWYWINHNQAYATFTILSANSFIAHTNGYPAIVVVKKSASSVNGGLVPFTKTIEGYTVFEVEDGKTYEVEA